MRLLTSWLVAIVIAWVVPVAAQQPSAAQPFPRVAIEESIPGPSVATEVLNALGRRTDVPLLVRIDATGAGIDLSALDERLTAYAARDVSIWLTLEPPRTLDAVEPWRLALRDFLSRRAGTLDILELSFADQASQLAAFTLRLAATEARLANEHLLVAAGGSAAASADAFAGFMTSDLAPYVDLVVQPSNADVAATVSVLRTQDPATRIVLRGDELSRETARSHCLETLLWTVGTDVAAVAFRGDAGALTNCIQSLSPVSFLVTGDIVELDGKASGLSIAANGRDLRESVRHRLLFDNKTFATLLVYQGAADADSMQVTVRLTMDGVPAVYDPVMGRRASAGGYQRDTETGVARAEVPLTGRPMMINFSEDASDVFVDRSDVAAAQQLSVEEIIARHQQQQSGQDARLRSYIANVRTEQHFRPTMTDPGYDVVTENRYFVDDSGVEWEELSFSVNGSKWGADRPPFPLLQPEKVLSLPLALRFDNDYRYRLAGTERIGDRECYVVRFEPVRQGLSLYRGTVWIDRTMFARLRVQAVQSALSAPVVSNEETHIYAPVSDGQGHDLYLLSDLRARQIVLIAGRNILLEKAAVFRDFEINRTNFADARQEARASNRVMYRETDRGLRYFVKEGETRVVSERATTHAKAMAMGVTIDPSFAFPLPIFGINYLDFEFGNKDTQLALLFAGVLAAGNLQRPKIGGTPFDASVDFFAIAVPSSDRLFAGGTEREADRLLTWPLSTGANLGWQYTPFQKATMQYQFRFDGFVRDKTTDESFVVPSSTTTNGLGGAWEYRRGGYQLALNGTWFARTSWREWGAADIPREPLRGRYTKYAASISRDFYFKVFHKIHLNAAYFGGRDLDRFSRYQFGMFDDTRLHGVPASGIRFNELRLVRGSYSFNIFDQYRLDLFADQGWGREMEGKAVPWQSLTGLGLAANLRAPWNTILRAEVGKSFLPDHYDIGSVTFQVMVLKPMR